MRERLPTLPCIPTVRVRLSQGLMTLSVESAGLGCIGGLPLVVLNGKPTNWLLYDRHAFLIVNEPFKL
jgi:hypothetical protein